MTPAMKGQLRQLMIKHEGYRTLPYLDTVGKITIGIGRNLSDVGVTFTEIDNMFDHDSQYFYDFLDNKFKWFSHLNEARQIALVDMCFMGTKSFLEFTNMLAACEKSDWQTAHDELLNSKYASQVGNRAKDLAQILLAGEL